MDVNHTLVYFKNRNKLSSSILVAGHTGSTLNHLGRAKAIISDTTPNRGEGNCPASS